MNNLLYNDTNDIPAYVRMENKNADSARFKQQESSGKRLNVLIAEDNPINQMVAEGIMTSIGHRADIVSNGLEAIEPSQNST